MTQTLKDQRNGHNEMTAETKNDNTSHPVPQNLENFNYKVHNIIFDLVPPLFLELSQKVDALQAEKKAGKKFDT
jgi:hypothetical protein